MEDKILKIGDRVRINAKWRSEFVQGLEKGKTGTIVKIHHYPQFTYGIKLDEPYVYMGYIIDVVYYYPQELEMLEA